MTIHEIIEQVDQVKPNSYSSQVKLRWIAQLDGKIAADLMRLNPLEIRACFDYQMPEDLETEPLVSFPHDDIYEAWLKAKIDEEDGEYEKYRCSMKAYNGIYDNFASWFLNKYQPSQRRDQT